MSSRGIGLSLIQASRFDGDRIATRTLTDDGKQIAQEMTWSELHREVRLLSSFLKGIPALSVGDRLGVLGRNSAEYLQLFYACEDAGIIIVPLNTRWSVDELRHAVADSGITVMAVPDREFLGVALDLAAPTAEDTHGVWWLLVPPQPQSDPVVVPGKQQSEVSQWRMFPVGGGGRAAGAYPVGRRETTADHYDTAGEIETARREDRDRDADGWGYVDKEEDVRRAAVVVADTEDVFCVVHTSGSTGRSKGVALTHLGQVLQAEAKCDHVGYTRSTTFLNVLPFCHVGGISSTLAVTMVAGCHVFLPRFTTVAGSAAVQAGRVNSLVVVPTMLHMLLKESLQSGAMSTTGASNLAGVKTVLIGGQSVSIRLDGLARRCMPDATFIQTYACSEAGSTIAFASSRPDTAHSPSRGALAASTLARDPGATFGAGGGVGAGVTGPEPILASIGGTPAAHVEIRVMERGLFSDDVVRPAAPGVVGEVETRGPHVMKGYWGKPELTAQVLRPDGWLRTGDLGRLDERNGSLVLVGRVKDVIKTGGENVHASEVEGVLLRHDWVAEAAAYGVEDDRLGEKVAASVVLFDDAQDQEGSITCDRARAVLSGFCGLHLSHYKRPRRIDVVLALPRNSAGKVLRHRLRSSL